MIINGGLLEKHPKDYGNFYRKFYVYDITSFSNDEFHEEQHCGDVIGYKENQRKSFM